MDSTYVFLQHYWWFVISLLGGLLVFLMFVQGGNVMLASPGLDDTRRRLVINSTGRKWEFTFTTLVTFGGAFFASFPLFYSTSFGGAYWVWMLILFTFVLQAVSYEFCSKRGNLLGARAYRAFLVINGLLAPFLVGVAVATFFTGSEFVVNRDNMTTLMPVISRWTGPLHGLEALGNVWNWVLGIAVALLVQMLGAMYVINNVDDARLDAHCRRVVKVLAVPFVAFFVSFVVFLLTTDGYAADPVTGEVTMQPGKYLTNFVEMPAVAAIFLAGVVLVLLGVWVTVMRRGNRRGIWLSGTAELTDDSQQLVEPLHAAHDGIRQHPHPVCPRLHRLCVARHRPAAHHPARTRRRRARLLTGHEIVAGGRVPNGVARPPAGNSGKIKKGEQAYAYTDLDRKGESSQSPS